MTAALVFVFAVLVALIVYCEWVDRRDQEPLCRDCQRRHK